MQYGTPYYLDVGLLGGYCGLDGGDLSDEELAVDVQLPHLGLGYLIVELLLGGGCGDRRIT